ncbi:MAG: TonB family protein [Flavobacteriales bacterium]|nr:TonB family protein [Flavobacteriales bacterium]
MELIQDRDKRTGLIVTIVFHVLVLILFMFIGLTQPDPLPEPEGAMIELGWTDSGSGDTESQVINENQQVEEVAPTETTPTESEAVEEEVVTQEESPVSTPETTPQETVQETTPEPEPDPQPSQELQDAMSNVFNSTPTGGGSEGEDEEGPGNTGRPDGSPAGKGVMGGSGNSWELAGRGYEGGAVVTEKPREEGKVVLNIWVGRDGKVTRTSLNLAASNTTSQHLVSLAEKAAKKARFNADPSSAVEQRGTMTFIFKLE